MRIEHDINKFFDSNIKENLGLFWFTADKHVSPCSVRIRTQLCL